jgi:hypothetical protein
MNEIEPPIHWPYAHLNFQIKSKLGIVIVMIIIHKQKMAHFVWRITNQLLKKQKTPRIQRYVPQFFPFTFSFIFLKIGKFNVNLWGNYQTLNKRFKNQVFWHYHKIWLFKWYLFAFQLVISINHPWATMRSQLYLKYILHFSLNPISRKQKPKTKRGWKIMHTRFGTRLLVNIRGSLEIKNAFTRYFNLYLTWN